MRKSKIPPRELLVPYVNNRKIAAETFKVTEKTIVRWMIKYELYEPKNNFGCNKLNINQAKEIRNYHKAGASVSDLCAEYKVTPSTIGRIIKNVTYKESEVAEVNVIYNFFSSCGSTIG